MLLDDFRKANSASIKALGASKKRLKRLLAQGLPPDEEERIDDELTRAEGEFNHAMNIEIRLKAAGVVVEPLDGDLLAEFNKLSAKLDELIVRDTLINATLEIVSMAIEDATKLNGIVSGNTNS